jgi:rRNA pseudouridine-1189 N-methylase Emg1 (Nep1/Mra1 family)
MIEFINEKDRTEENIRLAKNYDFYVGAIDDFSTYEKANKRNETILCRLKENGVEEVMFIYVPMYSSNQIKELVSLKDYKC